MAPRAPVHENYGEPSTLLTRLSWARIFSFCAKAHLHIAGWSSLVARRAHNPKVVGSNPAPATINSQVIDYVDGLFSCLGTI